MSDKPSGHKVEVVPVVLRKHSNADRLSIADVFDFTCVTETTQWKEGSLAAYIPPDSLVDIKRPEFSFLAMHANGNDKVRIKGKKIRGVPSFGLLVPAPEGSKVGDDVTEQLGVEHYNPPARGEGGSGKNSLFTSGEVAKSPNVYHVKYDLESGRRFASKTFQDGEPCIVTEKLHGSNSRYVFHDGVMYCGSRTEWKKEFPDFSHVTVESLEPKVGKEKAEEIVQKVQSRPKKKNSWWVALENTPGLRKLCEENPGLIVYGEVYGSVQNLNYGKTGFHFAAFDIMKDGSWLNFADAHDLAEKYQVPWVPIIAEMPFNFEKICELAEGKTTVKGANHVREGVVVRPVVERRHESLGRVCLKWVGVGYLEKSPDEIPEEEELI